MIHKPNQPIEPEKYYLTSAVRDMFPVLQARKVQWLYRHIRENAPGFFIDTAPGGKRPALLIKGSDIPAFMDTFNIVRKRKK